MAEITAVGVYMKFWFPNLPQWLPALAALAIMTAVNMVAVKFYGEFEFWFALIKVVTIIAMLVIGTLMIVFGVFHGGQPIGFSNLWSHGGFFAKGLTGPIMAMVMVSFAYLGIELIGVTAGEAQNPEKVIPSAIDKVLWRILVFYIGALTVIMSIFPWTEIGTSGSPFVLVFSGIGIKSAAGIINFVVLTAAMSSCNSGIFSTGRMLYNLSLQGEAPKSFAKLSSWQVPTNAIKVSAAFMLVGVLLNYVLPEKVFTYVTSVATFAAIWTWAIIIISQLNFRKSLSQEQIKELKYPMFAFPIANYIALIFLLFVIIIMGFDPDTRIALIVGPIWLAILTIVYYTAGINKVVTNKTIQNTDLEDVN
jgi:amino acid transporter, AAT family